MSMPVWCDKDLTIGARGTYRLNSDGTVVRDSEPSGDEDLHLKDDGTGLEEDPVKTTSIRHEGTWQALEEEGKVSVNFRTTIRTKSDGQTVSEGTNMFETLQWRGDAFED
ncbi:HERC1 [Symbiodinium sp. CCMP2592]|nr:HERC1 [Symbiodinium sp. CCMP2592]